MTDEEYYRQNVFAQADQSNEEGTNHWLNNAVEQMEKRHPMFTQNALRHIILDVLEIDPLHYRFREED